MRLLKRPPTVSLLPFVGQTSRTSIFSKNIVTMSTPLLRRLEDGTEEAVKEEDIFKYQRYRWLSNESERLTVRYRKFDLKALIDIATNLKGRSERSCTRVLKCVEGQFNKVFMLTMDDGDEVVAKIPNPNAGPSFYMLASEVATRHFLRSILDIPIPRIYAWSSDASNPVGAEYIIEEKADGQQLGSMWSLCSKDLQLDVVNQINEIEAKLAILSFSKYGSIYYKSDLEARNVRYEPLDSSIVQMAVSQTKTGHLENFAIGPSTDPRHWTDQKAAMDLSRGPWTNLVDYSRDIGLNEIQWAKSFAKPRMNFHRSMEHPETSNDYVSLLQRYLKLAPYLAGASPECDNRHTISHPDLHLDNIFADPKTKRITSIIDWQSTIISPISLQRKFPQFLEPLNEPPPDGPLAYYEGLVKRRDPLQKAIIDDRYHSIKTKPIQLVPGCWEREDLFSLRNSLISVIAHWKNLAVDSGPCPIAFSGEELESHQHEMDLIEGISSIMYQLQDEAMIALGGMVRPDDYERLREFNKRSMRDFIDLAENDRQKALHAKVWPYPDI